MNRQRLFILAASVAGIGSLFLPWQELPLSDEVVNGLHGNGLIVMACMLVSAVMAIAGKPASFLAPMARIACLLSGLLSVVLMIVYLSGFSDLEMRQSMSMAPYLTSIAAIAILAAAFYFRAPSGNERAE